ncbi:MAG TPA: FUSC family protein [Solirubrobacterales bacterium]|nr:FUSC family protein [Solirubrobacterales bacterium]
MRWTISDPGHFALKNAVRAAIVVPVAFALGLKVFALPQMALFGAFGSIGMLVFVDFGGTTRARLLAYLGLLAGGCLTIGLGTLCSHTTWVAVAAMGLVGFAILFAGVIDGYLAAASLVLILTFVIAAMVPAGVGEIPDRLAGWGLAGALSLAAIFGLWPGRPPDQLRRATAAALEKLAELLEAMGAVARTGAGPTRPAEERLGDVARTGERPAEERLGELSLAAYEATVAARGAFVAIPHRPSGVGARTAAIGRLIDDLDWFDALAREQPAPAAVSAGFAAERDAVETAVPAALRLAAERLRSNDPGDDGHELRRLADDHRAIGRAFLAELAEHRVSDDAKRVTAELNEAYRLRGLAFAALQIGRHAVQAAGGEAPREPTLTPARAGLRETRRIAESHRRMGSVWLRNSVRGAAGLALAVLVAKVTDAQNGFWVVLGTISVLRSSALATGTTVVEAIAGTVVGIVVGGLIVAALGSEPGLLWAVLPFAVLLGAYSPRAISFTAGQAGFTIVIVVLFNLLNPVGWSVGVVRIEDVAIGCAISLVTGFLFWPRGAADVLRGSIGGAYETAARYLDTTIATMLGVREAAPIEPVAVEASEAALRLDETVREYLAESGSARRDLDALARLVGGATRVRRVARLMHDATGIAPLSPLDSQAAWVAAVCGPFDREWTARRDWFEAFGRAIGAGEEAPAPEPGAPRRVEGPTSRLNRELGPEVVLDGAGEGRIPPGLAIAWAERHLEGLLALEPPLSDAAHAVLDDFAPRILTQPRPPTG